MPHDPTNAVVHLTMRRGEHDLAVGSGVLYRKDNKEFIVTAWHNVTGRHATTLEHLSNKGCSPDNLVAYIACRATNDSYVGYCRQCFTIPLQDSEKSLYFIHQQKWPRVDVVAIPIDPEHAYDNEGYLSTGQKLVTQRPMRQKAPHPALSMDIECIQDFMGAANDINVDLSSYLTASDDVFILGYPKGITDMYGQPIWKRATVATSPHLGWQRQKQFLVDCASREGMSGAPVISYNKGGPLQVGSTTFHDLGPVTIFLGVYASRMGHVSHFEAQIGTVWQKVLVDEIIDDAIYAPLSDEIDATPDEVRAAINDTWPESENYANLVLGEGYVIGYLLHEVMKKLEGRSNPDYVSEQIKEIAKLKLEGK